MTMLKVSTVAASSCSRAVAEPISPGCVVDITRVTVKMTVARIRGRMM